MNDKKFGKSNKMQVQKLPTGIEGFDDVCRGGLPVSRSTLVSGTSGTGKTVFSLQYLHHGICNFDEPGIFVTFEESPLDIIRNAASFGWDLQELIDQNKLFVLDASPDPDGQDVAGNFDLSGLIERISYAIRKYKAKRVAIDSITAVFQQYDAIYVVRREILENEFKGVYALKVIDVLKQPQLAEEDKILATPTLAKILPPPVRRIIGDLSDREKVLIGLDLLFDELTETEYSGDK